MKIRVEGKWYFVEVEDLSTDPAVVLVDGQKFEVKLEDIGSLIEEEKLPVAVSYTHLTLPTILLV
mgnify:CR=1 FL=1